MACDPRREDYLRMGLRFARSLNGGDPFSSARARSSFTRRYTYHRESLPQSDADRAFHLVAEATDIIDYQLPFASEEATEQLIDSATVLLDEAVSLNAACHDARRMLSAAQSPSFESFYRYLADGAEEVREDCEREQRASANLPEKQRQLAESLSMLPYVRWRAHEASRALICGHYTKSLEICDDILRCAPHDPCDVRFTYALAAAKLEDECLLARFEERCRLDIGSFSVLNPWMLLAELALAFKQLNEDTSAKILSQLIRSYPHAAVTLSNQDELPEGVFSRLVVSPFSEDELILAVSEASVLLQEGRSVIPKGSLGSWISEQPQLRSALENDSRYNHEHTHAVDSAPADNDCQQLGHEDEEKGQ